MSSSSLIGWFDLLNFCVSESVGVDFVFLVDFLSMYFLPNEGPPEPIHMLNFNPVPLPSFLEPQKSSNADRHIGSFQCYGLDDDPAPLNDPNYIVCQSSYPDRDITQIPDFPDDCLKFINDILMEEDLDNTPISLQDYNALQATEKSLYDALGEAYPASSDPVQSSVGQSTESSDDPDRSSGIDKWGNRYYPSSLNVVETTRLINQSQLDPSQMFDAAAHPFESNCHSFVSSNNFDHSMDGVPDSPISTLSVNETRKEESVSRSRSRKNHQRDGAYLEQRSTKQIASSNEEYGEMERFDDVLICREGNDDISPCTRKTPVHEADDNSEPKGKSRGSKSKSKSRVKKKSNEGQAVDLRTQLIQCAEAVASFELKSANELLRRIRQHASPFGDSVQRLAHYFANGLEARLAGTGSESYKDFAGKKFSSYDILRGYKSYVQAVPFQRTTMFLTNQTIVKLAEKATRVHIIDFGIFFGFQWPCLVQNLSRRPQGSPILKITGVDHPQSGFRPAQKVEETGRRLAGYCERFGVPFEFHPIAQRWHTLKPEHFKIESNELVVVTCFYQSGKLPDETVDVNSPRDHVLRLIRGLNPDLFIHGVINGTFNAPFFVTRFKEALYHYSSLFDVFDATIDRESHERLLTENYLYGKDALNIVACEGNERIERPETYKQWQVRKLRAGFKQVPLDQDIVNGARAMVKANYNKDFMVEQDRNWMVQGWKGRILSAISCWKPA